MQKIIMFNGPPRAGKDTAGQICKHLLGEHAHLVKFTDVVKEETHRQLGLSCPNDAYEALKDTPLAEFAGLTPRAAYIETSTRMKREHGPHIVAEMTVQKLRGVNAWDTISKARLCGTWWEHRTRCLSACIGPSMISAMIVGTGYTCPTSGATTCATTSISPCFGAG